MNNALNIDNTYRVSIMFVYFKFTHCEYHELDNTDITNVLVLSPTRH